MVFSGITKGTSFDPKNSYADKVRDKDVADNPGATPLETAVREPVFYGAPRVGQAIGTGVEAVAGAADTVVDKAEKTGQAAVNTGQSIYGAGVTAYGAAKTGWNTVTGWLNK